MLKRCEMADELSCDTRSVFLQAGKRRRRVRPPDWDQEVCSFFVNFEVLRRLLFWGNCGYLGTATQILKTDFSLPLVSQFRLDSASYSVCVASLQVLLPDTLSFAQLSSPPSLAPHPPCRSTPHATPQVARGVRHFSTATPFLAQHIRRAACRAAYPRRSSAGTPTSRRAHLRHAARLSAPDSLRHVDPPLR